MRTTLTNRIDDHRIDIVIHPHVESDVGTSIEVGTEVDCVDYTVEITATDYSDEAEDDPEPAIIGRAFAYRLNAASAGLGESASDVADELSDELADIVGVMHLDTMSAAEPYNAFPGVDRRPTNGDLLHLEGFLIDEEWEGKGVDLLVAELIIRNLGHGASITTMVDDGPGDGTDPTVREQATRHWARIGLTPYPTDPYILWHPCGYIRRPQP